MKFKSTFLLLILLVAGAVAVYLLDYKPGEEQKVEEFLEKKFIPFEADSISEIDLIIEDEKVSLVKSENEWYIGEPIRVKADQNVVKSLISVVSNTKKGRKVSESSNLSVFGLDPSKISLIFRLNNGEEAGYSVGDESPTGEFVFAKQHNNPEIFTVPKEIYTQSNKKLYDLRLKSLVSLRSNEVHKIYVKSKTFTYDINWNADKLSYMMVTPAILPIETTKMNAYFSRISRGKASIFIDTDKPAHSLTGLEDGETYIRLWASDPPRQEILMIGTSVTRDGKAYRYARDASRSAIMLIDSSLAAYLEKDPFELIQKEIIKFEKDKVDEIVLTYSGITIQITKNDGIWKLSSSEDLIAEDTKVNDFLDNVLSLKATAVEDYNPTNQNRYGISPLILYLSISENGKVVNSIQAGNTKGDESYIQSSNSTAVFRVKSEAIEKLKVHLNYFKNDDLTELDES